MYIYIYIHINKCTVAFSRRSGSHAGTPSRTLEPLLHAASVSPSFVDATSRNLTTCSRFEFRTLEPSLHERLLLVCGQTAKQRVEPSVQIKG